MKTVKCPLCGAVLNLVVKPGDEAHLIARHNCGDKPMRTVLETDNPDYQSLQDRLEPAERIPDWPPPKKGRTK